LFGEDWIALQNGLARAALLIPFFLFFGFLKFFERRAAGIER
jgi:hypothetical protein